MNILFLTMNSFTGIDMHNIYSDLMCEFIRHGHRPYIVTPRERKSGEKTELLEFTDYGILKVQIGNTSGVSLIEKGISTVTLSDLYYRAVKKYLGKHSFGLMLYSTPPITLAAPVKKLKKLFGCPPYLMLKDIFPQNAVDLGMFSRKSPIYAYFAAQERMLYAVSDYIGCMSQANVDYVLKHNPVIDPAKVEICPNSVEMQDLRVTAEERNALRNKYGIPLDKKVFVYCEKEVLRCNYKLYELEEMLAQAGFVRVSKSVILNVEKLTGIKTLVNSKLEAMLVNGERVCVTRKYLKDIRNELLRRNKE